MRFLLSRRLSVAEQALFVCCVLPILLFHTCAGVKDGLYDTDDDNVLPLNNKSYDQLVVKSKPDLIWVVEFYNSWCGHCIHFAPTWKMLGYKLKEWRDLVQIAAIDCSQSQNLEVCRDHQIERYPTVKIFPPTSVKNRMQTENLIVQSQEFLIIKKDLIDFFTENTPTSWPSLKPLLKIEDIWKDKKDSHHFVILVFEESSSYVGREVILDLRKYSNVLIRRMLKSDVTKYGITAFPSIYHMKHDSTYSLITTGSRKWSEDRLKFVKAVKALVGNNQPEEDGGGEEDASIKEEDKNLVDEPMVILKKTRKNLNSTKISMQDLESALHYSFRQEIAICNILDTDRFTALYGFVKVLLKYFPGRMPIQGFLMKVEQMLATLKSRSLTGEEWVDRIDRIQDTDNFLPEVVKWQSCNGSSPKYRGYPCSMWILFHTLTVGAYIQSKDSPRGAAPMEVPLAIKGYMQHFFGCEECSKNFIAMTRTLSNEIQNMKTSVLWLWSAHNKANKRLHGDASEDPAAPKVQFPPPELCRSCRNSEGSWVVDSVFAFLVRFYSKQNLVVGKDLIFHPESLVVDSNAKESAGKEAATKGELDWWENKQKKKALDQVKNLRKRKGKRLEGKGEKFDVRRMPRSDIDLGYRRAGVKTSHTNTLWGLTHLDLSMCVLFYVVSTLIILFLYHHFIVRRHMSPCGSKKSLLCKT